MLAEDGELCIISKGNGQTVAALDRATDKIRTWELESGIYTEKASIPIEVPSNAPNLIAATFSSPQNGNVTGAFLFTDGHHDGHHQLTLYYDDGTGAVLKNIYTWTKGVPTDVVSSQIQTTDEHYRSGYFVSLESAPYLIFVAGADLRYSAPAFGPIEYAPAPLWVKEIKAAGSTDLDSSALVLTRNKAGSVSVIELKPQP